MFRLSTILLLISCLTFHSVSCKEECEATKYIVSKCYNHGDYQWLIEIPKTKTSCEDQTVALPRPVKCNFACPEGETFNRHTLKCKSCSQGTFSLGGGIQYTFSDLDSLRVDMPELSLKATSLLESSGNECKRKDIWRVKSNILQGEVQHNCVISLSFRFKLARVGSISIAYNLPTSFVFGTISSRCDFNVEEKNDNDNQNTDDNDDDDENESEPKKKVNVHLKSTGYGIWKTERIEIDTPGDYILVLYTFGVNAFHFPFSIRSIVVEGSAFVQDCIDCAPGTYSDKESASTCKPCPKNTYSNKEGSTECKSCTESQYSDEGSSKCIDRPQCEAKHYQKVFTGCDKSDMTTITYRPIEPKICIGDAKLEEVKPLPCGTCNPGMYKNPKTLKCEFCPAKTYSNGTMDVCKSCVNELSLVPGLYYKIWNELPDYLNRSYMSFDDINALNDLRHHQSWVPSIEYIVSQAVPDTLSILTLTIAKGFRETEIAKTTKEYGTLYFKFSIQCQSSCTFFLVAEDIYDEDDSNWQVLHKWHIKEKSDHKDIKEFKYTVENSDELVFNWMFASDDEDQGTDEARIYEIRVTNTILGGSDRCVTCLTVNDQETECKQCTPGYVLTNTTCVACPNSTIASRVRSHDPVPTVCKPCPINTISEDGISCYVPCKQSFNGTIPYDLNAISTIEFHGSKLFTQKGSGYFHVFNASICGKTSVTCTKSSSSDELKHRTNKKITDSKLCRMGSVPDKSNNVTSIAYIDNFGEELVDVSSSVSKHFPPLRSDYSLPDITFVYRANTSNSESTCSQRTTFLSLRCDHFLDDQKENSTKKYQLQTSNECVTGTCDGCTFHFLLRTPLACPICDGKIHGFRTFFGTCKFGRQEVRQIPYPYCAENLKEKVEIRRCSVLSTEIQIIFALFVLIAIILISVVIMCWRKNRKLEYRYMQLVENTNPDDDTPVDNVCAQISDEEDSGDEVHFKKPSKAKKLMNVVRNAIRKNPTDNHSDFFNGDSFLLTSATKNDA